MICSFAVDGFVIGGSLLMVDCSFVDGLAKNVWFLFFYDIDGGIWYDYVHGSGAIFSYVHIAGGGVRDISLIFARVLARGFCRAR